MKWLKNILKPHSGSELMVRVYSPTTKTITEIPASQLTPNMVQAKLEGHEGVHWIDARELQPGERRAESFPEEIRDYFREIKTKLDEVYSLSLEEWEDGFLRDSHPEREIALWLHIADIYSSFTHGHYLSLEQKEEYFRLLATCLNSSREMVLQLYTPKLMPKAEAEKLIAAYYEPSHIL